MSNDKAAATWFNQDGITPAPIARKSRVWHVTEGSGVVLSVDGDTAIVRYDSGALQVNTLHALVALPATPPYITPTNPTRRHSGKAVWGALAFGFVVVVLAVVVLGVRAAAGSPAPFYGACPDTTVNCSTMQPATDLFGGK